MYCLVSNYCTNQILKLNASKSKEMIVARRLAPSARPPPLQDIERVTEMLILGVILRGDLRASSHVHRVLSLCNGSLHALRVLGWHGLSADGDGSYHHLQFSLCFISLVGPDIC